jgi:hypothetical protein
MVAGNVCFNIKKEGKDNADSYLCERSFVALSVATSLDIKLKTSHLMNWASSKWKAFALWMTVLRKNFLKADWEKKSTKHIPGKWFTCRIYGTATTQ